MGDLVRLIIENTGEPISVSSAYSLMTLNKPPVQVPGGLTWRAFAISAGFKIKRGKSMICKVEEGSYIVKREVSG